MAGVVMLGVLAGLLVQLSTSTHEDEDSFLLSAAAIAVVVVGIVRLLTFAQRRQQFIYELREDALDEATSDLTESERERGLLEAEKHLVSAAAFDDAAVIAEARRDLARRSGDHQR